MGSKLSTGKGRTRRRLSSWLPGLLMVSPSIVLVGLFVYALIGWNFSLALSSKHSEVDPQNFVGLENFIAIWSEERWMISVKNATMFTVVFVGGAMLLGWMLAFLMDKGIKGEVGFRAVYLFPMAISFIATGIAWRWLMDPAAGLNSLFKGLNLDFLANDWFQDDQWGMAAIAIPAVWQMSGYVMALFLAGFRGVSDDLREAARVDGASEWKVYRYIVLPQLRPVTFSALIILGHISLKVFDLVVAIAGKQIFADVPAVFMWQAAYDYHDPAKGATIGSYILLAVAVFIIPYLIWSIRAERKS